MSDAITISVELVKRAQVGDREALNRLFARYYDRVQRIVRIRLGPRLRERVDSADILQETFRVAVEKFDRFEMRDEASLIRWLAMIAEHQITAQADHFNAQKRDHRREVSLPIGSESSSGSRAMFDPPANAPLPIDALASREAREVVDSCVRGLSDEYRELIVWRDFAGAEWDVVARETGRPSAAAARMMHARALVELSKAIRERGLS
jgi:RNA polymerase sigma-70 factor (subfamily 1)